MNCPACALQLEAITVGEITVDVCTHGCGGVWFDQFELKKVDEPNESAGEILLNIDIEKTNSPDPSQRRMCPKCEDIIMMRHFFSVKREVEVDECPNCGGFWLDYGELASIRTQFESEDDRKKAANAYFEDIFGTELKRMQNDSDQQLGKAQKIANMFRFVCPSSYIPGKQKWGAF